nr:uncharacterized protein LOC113708360 [Coffea arabica]
MVHKASIESVDKLLRDIMDSNDLFGSKVIVFGGDFRQVLPVVTKGSKSEFIDASIVNSYIWPQLHKLHLTQNMRARHDPEFTQYLLRIGNITEPVIFNNSIQIPPSMLIRYTNEEESMIALIRMVFPDLKAFSQENLSAVNRAILTTKNDYVDEINERLIVHLEGQLQEYISRNKCIDNSEQTIIEDLLNSLTPNGFLPHKLLVKPYCPIMLLRNIDAPQGLCNGTRLICKSLSSNIIHAVITCGEFAGKEVFIHRICFRAENNSDSPRATTATREVVIIDKSMMPVILTLWGEHETDEGQAIANVIDTMPLIVALRIKVSSYHSKATETQAEIKKLITEKAYHNRAKLLQQLRDDELTTIQDFLAFPTKKAYWLHGTPRLLDKNERLWYNACPQCHKSFRGKPVWKIVCTSCNKQVNIAPRCRLTLELADYSGVLTLDLYDNDALQLLPFTLLEI